MHARVSEKIHRQQEENSANGLIPDDTRRPHHFRNHVVREPFRVVDVCVPIRESKRLPELHHVLMLAPG